MSNDPVETYLRGLMAGVGDIPFTRQLTDADLGTARGTASIARAALAHHLDGKPEAIAARLRQELADADLYVRYRMASASRDVADGFEAPSPYRVVCRNEAEWLRWYEANHLRRIIRSFVDPGVAA